MNDTFLNRWLARVSFGIILVAAFPFTYLVAHNYAESSTKLMNSQTEINRQLANSLQVFGAVNNGPGGVVLYGAGSEIVYVTDGIERLTGWSQTEIIADNTQLVLIPDVLRLYLERSKSVEVGKRLRLGPQSGVLVRTKNGALLPVIAEAWQYDWQNEHRLCLFLVPDEPLVTPESRDRANRLGIPEEPENYIPFDELFPDHRDNAPATPQRNPREQ